MEEATAQQGVPLLESLEENLFLAERGGDHGAEEAEQCVACNHAARKHFRVATGFFAAHFFDDEAQCNADGDSPAGHRAGN